MFRAALEHGTMEGWFALAEQFHTQAEPAFCGLGSLVVALNALGVDPQRPWKGSWRWYSEELLDCCVPLPHVQAHGVTLEELACLARCNGLIAEVHRADRRELARLRDDALAAARGDGSVVIASYDRGALGQTGAGHFSPLGGVDAEEQRALVLDVARFKYPPHWVELAQLHQAMQSADPSTGQARGWLVLRRRPGGVGTLATLFCGHAGWRDAVAAFAALGARWRASPPRALATALEELRDELPLLHGFVQWRTPSEPGHARQVAAMRAELRHSRAGQALAREAGLHDEPLELAALLLLVLAPRWAGELAGAPLAATLAELVDDDALGPALRAELELVRQQLAQLTRVDLAASCRNPPRSD
jgi:glutathione gamma-glutamylcysteinyltransferase